MNLEVAGLHLARQVIYATLAEVFLQLPTTELLQRQTATGTLVWFPLEIDRPEVEEGLGLVRQWEASLETKSLTEVVRELRLDYTRLFMGPGKVLAPPWESVYRTEERLLFREPTMQVREFYRRHGLEVPRLNREPDDHFGLELAFMAVLAERTISALEKAGEPMSQASGGTVEAYRCGKGEVGDGLVEVDYLLREQHRFLQEHLGQWVKAFTGDVGQYAATGYYRGMALVARGFVLEDNEWLGSLIDL